MLINIDYLVEKYNFHPKSCIQIGCHNAEEHDDLIRIGVKKFVYIEPCKKAFTTLTSMFEGNSNVRLIKCACGSEEFETEMNIESVNGGQSNSILNPKEHLIQHPTIVFNEKEIVQVKRLDDLIPNPEDYDLILCDVQGYEKNVLLGAKKVLENISYIYLEVNRAELYEGCAKVEEIDEILWQAGFKGMEVKWIGGWGDKYYQRRKN